MNIEELCRMLHMPEEVISEVTKFNAEEYREALEHFWISIQDKSKWGTAVKDVKKILTNDKNGIECLAFMLQIGLRTYQEYVTKGISEKIFKDTMEVFSRFVKEHMESYGCYGFDREWWTVRELTLNEFRLGELEFEMADKDNKRIISVHIPSDAKLNKDNCREAYRYAESFFADYAKDYAEVEYYCESWLLSPELKKLLPKESNILSFQNDFIIDEVHPEESSYMEWVFKNKAKTLDQVPQDTSLQRKMKEHLINGGKIGEGIGHLKKEIL